MLKKILLAPFAIVLGLIIAIPVLGTLAIAILVGFALIPIVVLYVVFYFAYEIIAGSDGSDGSDI